MWSDTVTLRGKTITYVNGFPVEGDPTDVNVFADRHSVKSSIFYAAQASGIQLDIAFTVNISEYAGQKELIYAGVSYDVKNTYELDSERIDLNCSRR